MSSRYDERDYDRGDDDDRYERRDDYDRRDENYGRERYERGATSYGGARSTGGTRDYDDLERDRDYWRTTGARETGYGGGASERDYERNYGGAYERGRAPDYDRTPDFGRGYARDDARSYSRGRERDYGGDYERTGGYERGGGSYTGARGGRDYDDDYDREARGYQYERERGDWSAGRRGRGEEERGRGRERGWWDRVSDEVASWFGDEGAERRRLRDEQRAGAHHRGRGPRGYRRSDERIREDINDRLTDHPYLDATDIEVRVTDGEVTLTGSVDSRQAKRLAEDLAESVSGVNNVENRLRVGRGAEESRRPDELGRPDESRRADDATLVKPAPHTDTLTGPTDITTDTTDTTRGTASGAAAGATTTGGTKTTT
jgi:osmotically-inducible protein OsmY